MIQTEQGNKARVKGIADLCYFTEIENRSRNAKFKSTQTAKNQSCQIKNKNPTCTLQQLSTYGTVKRPQFDTLVLDNSVFL